MPLFLSAESMLDGCGWGTDEAGQFEQSFLVPQKEC